MIMLSIDFKLFYKKNKSLMPLLFKEILLLKDRNKIKNLLLKMGNMI